MYSVNCPGLAEREPEKGHEGLDLPAICRQAPEPVSSRKTDALSAEFVTRYLPCSVMVQLEPLKGQMI